MEPLPLVLGMLSGVVESCEELYTSHGEYKKYALRLCPGTKELNDPLKVDPLLWPGRVLWDVAWDQLNGGSGYRQTAATSRKPPKDSQHLLTDVVRRVRHDRRGRGRAQRLRTRADVSAARRVVLDAHSDAIARRRLEIAHREGRQRAGAGGRVDRLDGRGRRARGEAATVAVLEVAIGLRKDKSEVCREEYAIGYMNTSTISMFSTSTC